MVPRKSKCSQKVPSRCISAQSGAQQRHRTLSERRATRLIVSIPIYLYRRKIHGTCWVCLHRKEHHEELCEPRETRLPRPSSLMMKPKIWGPFALARFLFSDFLPRRSLGKTHFLGQNKKLPCSTGIKPNTRCSPQTFPARVSGKHFPFGCADPWVGEDTPGGSLPAFGQPSTLSAPVRDWLISQSKVRMFPAYMVGDHLSLFRWPLRRSGRRMTIIRSE